MACVYKVKLVLERHKFSSRRMILSRRFCFAKIIVWFSANEETRCLGVTETSTDLKCETQARPFWQSCFYSPDESAIT